MKRSLTQLIPTTTPAVYYSQEFMTALEYHIDRLVRHAETTITNIEDGLAYQYSGDFYGLLTHLGIPNKYHWVTLRCNTLYSPDEYKVTHTSIILPPFTEIDDIQSIWSSNANLSIG